MQVTNSCQSYGVLSKWLHWMISICMIGMIWLGWYMVDLGYYDRWYHDALSIHKAVGIAVLGLGTLKIAWTLYTGLPDPVSTIKPWERTAARATHIIFFLLMVLIPVAGYVISTSEGRPVSVFGWFDVPVVYIANAWQRDLAIAAHYYLAYGTALLVAVHASAALKHQFLDRDGTLRRML